MSALLTTTMSNMQPMIATIRAKYPETKVVVGGAPLNAEFAQKIGADAYARDPQDNINWLESRRNNGNTRMVARDNQAKRT